MFYSSIVSSLSLMISSSSSSSSKFTSLVQVWLTLDIPCRWWSWRWRSCGGGSKLFILLGMSFQMSNKWTSCTSFTRENWITCCASCLSWIITEDFKIFPNFGCLAHNVKLRSINWMKVSRNPQLRVLVIPKWKTCLFLRTTNDMHIKMTSY